MIKQLLLAVFLLLSSYAVKANDWVFNWGHMLDAKTEAGDNVVGLAQAADGNYFVAVSWGTRNAYTNKFQEKITDSWNLFLDGEAIRDADGDVIKGAEYQGGNSNNDNVALQKYDQAGNLLWTVYSDRGNIDAANTRICATKDGGVLLLLTVRPWVQDPDTVVQIKGTNNTSFALTDVLLHGKKIYHPVLVKVNAGGELVYVKQIFTYDYPEGISENRSPSALFYTKAFCTDDDENIYVVGNLRTRITMQKADSSKVVMNPHNVEGWDGDVQKRIGCMFLLKFDKDVNFVQGVTDEGSAIFTYLDVVTYKDGKLYAAGIVKGNGEKVGWGGITFSAPTHGESFVLTSLNTRDLNVNYVRLFSASENNKAVHLKNIECMGEQVYILGGSRLGEHFDEDGNTILKTTGNMFEGMMLRCDANTGKVNAYVTSQHALSENFGIMDMTENNGTLGVLGYVFSGLTLYSYETLPASGLTLKKTDEKILIKLVG